ncbi:hypothetical protein F5Y04DRAFT_291404 [Hypomontagnella monticulosa]|nr:hypothetical protein F5Y04DRAFT_291404 [Hypomontagnella monticulosa]
MVTLLKLWRGEIGAAIGSGLCFIGITILLAIYNGKPIFSWHGVTLNAVVSVLSTAGRSSLMLAVEEATSQWKWILFSQRPRALIDFDRMDEASRGPLGSIILLWRCRGVSFVRLGAALILLSLVMDPFAQQLIQLQQEFQFVTNGSDNTISRAKRYSRGNEIHVQLQDSVSADADFAMQSAILYGLSHAIDNVVQQLEFTCPSSNCTWDPFDSLAICSVCNNVTSQVERLQDSGGLVASLQKDNDAAIALPNMTAFRLPNGLIIDNLNNWNYTSRPKFGGIYMTTFGTPNPNETNTLQAFDSLIWSMSVFKVHPNESNASAVWPDFPLEATECGIHYCVNTYESSVQNAILHEKSTATSASRNPRSWEILASPYDTGNLTQDALTSIAFNNRTSSAIRSDFQFLVSSPDGGSKYNISQNAIDSISAYFEDVFAGKLVVGGNSTASISGRVNGYYIRTNQVQYEPSINQALWESRNLTALFESLAASMSNAIRSGADGGANILGKTGIVVTVYQVQWPWITLHAFTYLVGVAFLIFTISKSRKTVPVWKGSSLASLSFGARVGGVFGGLTHIREMEHRARSEKAKLLLQHDNIPLDDLLSVNRATATKAPPFSTSASASHETLERYEVVPLGIL